MSELLPGVRVPSWVGLGADGARLDPDAFGETLAALWRLPKVELHLHLEGSLRPETVCELAGRYDLDSPLCRAGWQAGYWSFRDLAGFVVELGQVIRACMRAPEDYERVARECFEDLAAQGVRYAEVSFAPRRPGRPHYVPLADVPHYVPLADVLAAIDQARRDVEARTDFRAGLIVGLGRQHATEEGAAGFMRGVIAGAVRARDAGAAVVGIDLHGDEQSRPDVGPFVEAFREAAEAGLGLRAHAGEGAGPASVRDAVRRLGVARIAHGVRAMEDYALVEQLARADAALDMCVTSNVMTGAVASLARHPIRAFRDAGVPITVSSDDPVVFETTVTTELALLHHGLGFSLPELGDLTATAAARGFLPKPDRAALVRLVRATWPAAEAGSATPRRPT